MAEKRDNTKVPRRPGEIRFWSQESQINDCMPTQRCPSPEILIASPVISRTTSQPSGGRARMMVAIVAGCRSVRTFRDCHNSIAFTIDILHSIIRAYV